MVGHHLSERPVQDRKSTRLNSSHMSNSYAVFCLKKKKNRCCQSRSILETLKIDSAELGRKNTLYFRHRAPGENTQVIFFFFNDTATTGIYTLSLHDALPI